MKKLKVMTIIGTRPEIIRLSEIIKACDRHFEHILVHTGQNYDYTLNEIFFQDFALRKPDYFLDAAKDDLGQTMGRIIAASYKVMRDEKPDALLILGDTNSALSAIPAKRLKIPIFHMEAGNRCFDQNVPEEINRKIVDHISDINLPYTEHSRRYLLSEGFRKEHIVVTGSPLTEVLKVNGEKIHSSSILETLKLQKNRYFVVSMHREENLDHESVFRGLVKAINDTAGQYKQPLIFSTHPRTLKKIEALKIEFNPLIRNIKPLGFFDYVKLQKNAFCVLSDSGTLSEESAIMGFPAVLIRNSTERPEVLDSGNIIIAGITSQSILQSVSLARVFVDKAESSGLPRDYTDTNVAEKIIRIIQSYTHIINKFTWDKNIYA